jgi:hypothetical protein
VAPADPARHGLLQASRALTATEMQASDAARKAGRVLSPLQIRLAANHLGLRDEIEALITDPATPRNFRDYWEYASEYRRDHPLWPQALSLIGKTAADLDALYDLGQTF